MDRLLDCVDELRKGVEMSISSRTPEGSDKCCPICGSVAAFDPSSSTRDGPCPSCGHLLWFRSEATEFHLDESAGTVLARFVGPSPPEEIVYLLRLVDERRASDFRLDLSDLATLDSTFLGRIITLHRKLQAQNGRLVLCGLRDELKEMLTIVQLDRIFRIE